MTSLLPLNRTPLETALESTQSRVDLLSVPIRVLWDPWACPEHLLPWLAWAVSVETWDSQWPAQVKRQTIDASIAVHMKKGTIGALKKGLAAFGVSTQVLRWFEYGGQPQTAKVRALASDNLGQDGTTLLTPALQRQLLAMIEHTKPVSAHIDFELGASVTNSVCVASAMRTDVLQRTQADCKVPETPRFAHLSLAVACPKVKEVQYTQAPCDVPIANQSSLSCAISGHSYTLEYTIWECQ